MYLRLKTVLYFFILFLYSGKLISQPFKINLISEDSGQPVQFANVCWQSMNNGSEKGFAVSDEKGMVVIGYDDSDKISVSISCVGYKNLIDTVDHGVETVIQLEEDLLNLEQVVITGTRTPKRLANTPVQTSVIPEIDLKRAGAVSPLEAIQDFIPGLVNTSNAMGNNLRMRGLNSRYILFLVDGERLVSEGAGGNVNLNQIDFNNIERIEVVNGASSALYGSNAVGAVINIITKKPVHNFEGGINTSLQSHNTNKLQLNIGSNHHKISLGTNLFRNNTDGYDNEEGPSSRPHTDYGAGLKLGYTPSERVSANINARFFQHQVFNFTESMNAEHDLDRKVTLGGRSEVMSENKRNQLKASVNFDKYFKYDVMERKNNQLEKQNDITYAGGRLVNTYSPGKKWEAITGIEYNYEEISTDSSKILGSGPTLKKVVDANAFFQIQYQFFEGFHGVLGSRYTHNEQFGAAFSPKLSLMYKTDRFVFRGGTGTAFRAPALKELYYNFNHNGSFWVYGNSDLVPEKGLYNSLSVEYTKGTLNMSVTGYKNQINDKITSLRILSDLGQPDRYYKNVSSSTLQGVDFNISYVLLKQFIVKSTYSYCDARDNSTGLQLTSNVNHSATIALTWNGKVADSPFTLHCSGRLASPILNEYIETDVYGNDIIINNSSNPYNIWKATFIKPVRINVHLLELILKCDNIFNFRDIYFTNPGRQYMIGLRYKFR